MPARAARRQVRRLEAARGGRRNRALSLVLCGVEVGARIRTDTPRPRAPREPGWIKSRDKRDLETVLTWRTQLGGFVFEPSATSADSEGQAGGLGRAERHPAARPSPPLCLVGTLWP